MKATDDGEESRECPCCRRGLRTAEEKRVFETTMMEMIREPSVLVKAGTAEAYNKVKEQLTLWKKAVSDNMSDVRDLLRLTKESKELEKDVKELEAAVIELQQSTKAQKSEVDDIQLEGNELRDIVDASKRWTEDARRIAEQKVLIEQKRLDLSILNPNQDRDLRTVENEFSALMEEKDKFTNDINDLNKQMTQLNEMITNSASQVSCAC